MLAVGCGLATVLIVLAPVVARRTTTDRSNPNTSRESFNSNGRFEAWAEFYRLAEANRFFGRGLGSGPITHIEEVGFTAQHNEYLRMYLEGGYVGTLLVLAGIGGTLVLVVRAAPKAVRADLLALAAAFAWFSVTDNTLSTPHFIVPFAVLLGGVASITTAPRRGPDDAAPRLARASVGGSSAMSFR